MAISVKSKEFDSGDSTQVFILRPHSPHRYPYLIQLPHSVLTLVPSPLPGIGHLALRGCRIHPQLHSPPLALRSSLSQNWSGYSFPSITLSRVLHARFCYSSHTIPVPFPDKEQRLHLPGPPGLSVACSGK